LSIPTTPAKPIYRANAHLVRQQLQTLNASGRWVALVGVPARVFIAATPTGAPLSGLGPFTATFNTAGELVYTISAAAVDAGLAAIADDVVVYQVVIAGLFEEYRGVTPLRVTVPRYVP
jgi:hypothetical protein